MKNKIQNIEVCFLMYFIMISSVIGIGLNNSVIIAKTDAYLIPIIGSLLGIIPLFFIIKIINYKENLDVFSKIKILFDSKIGNLINIILILFVTFFMTCTYWNLINFINSQYLIDTPKSIIFLIITFVILYTINKDFEVFGRTVIIIFFIDLSLFLLSLLGLIKEIDLNNLLPFLEHGIKNPLIASFSYVSTTILPVFLITLIPKGTLTKKNKLTKHLIITYVVTNIIIFLIFGIVISVFGYEMTYLYQYPTFNVQKKILLTTVFSRIEIILSMQWLFNLMSTITFSLFFINKGIKNVFKIKNKKLFLLINFMLLLITNIIFQNNTDARHFATYIYPYVLAIGFIIIPFVIFIKIKKTN